ncbi:hypothetical protein COU37_04435 [Candidatus Micrarchaeota archaeon CG10_big_fil_rev_8_21_14_0_10_45_29]|nr:MAG: hypothetical protein COU37_04435 [Candidatus Micrarchaeota archaeon CG10_big_fil_rev_8_21_14_0_10_45_29]
MERMAEGGRLRGILSQYGLGFLENSLGRIEGIERLAGGGFGTCVLSDLALKKLFFPKATDKINEFAKVSFETFRDIEKDFDEKAKLLLFQTPMPGKGGRMLHDIMVEAFAYALNENEIKFAPTASPATGLYYKYLDCDTLSYLFIQLCAKYAVNAKLAAVSINDDEKADHAQAVVYLPGRAQVFIKSEFLLEKTLTGTQKRSWSEYEDVPKDEIYGLEGKVEKIFEKNENTFLSAYNAIKSGMKEMPEKDRKYYEKIFGFENEREGYLNSVSGFSGKEGIAGRDEFLKKNLDGYEPIAIEIVKLVDDESAEIYSKYISEAEDKDKFGKMLDYFTISSLLRSFVEEKGGFSISGSALNNAKYLKYYCEVLDALIFYYNEVAEANVSYKVSLDRMLGTSIKFKI